MVPAPATPPYLIWHPDIFIRHCNIAQSAYVLGTENGSSVFSHSYRRKKLCRYRGALWERRYILSSCGIFFINFTGVRWGVWRGPPPTTDVDCGIGRVNQKKIHRKIGRGVLCNVHKILSSIICLVTCKTKICLAVYDTAGQTWLLYGTFFFFLILWRSPKMQTLC
jgi:hypothetical protein